MTGSTDITFVLTSCSRFDLLAETLRTFLASNTAAISRYVFVEDSGDPQISDVLASFDVRFEPLIKDPPRGQMASIDLAHSRVHTPYIFQCEDDWRFFRSGFVEESLQLLEQIATISTVKCRRPGQNDLHDSNRLVGWREPPGRYRISPAGGWTRIRSGEAIRSIRGCGDCPIVARWDHSRHAVTRST
jgi:hypothetical protein